MKKNDLIYNTILFIPKGKVATYGQIAKLTNIQNPRMIGNILHANPYPDKFPCHRIVRSDGSLAKGYAFGGRERQGQRLSDEGITVTKGKINLKEHLWHPSKYLIKYLYIRSLCYNIKYPTYICE